MGGRDTEDNGRVSAGKDKERITIMGMGQCLLDSTNEVGGRKDRLVD